LISTTGSADLNYIGKLVGDPPAHRNANGL